MSNEIIPLRAGNKALGIVPTTVEEVFRIATAVARSGLAPRGMDSQEKLTVAIMTGLELGLPPMFAINKIAVVNGRPTLWGDGIPALLWGAGFKIREWMEGDNGERTAHCEITRPGGDRVVRTFAVADAKKAGLWGKQGPWSQYPDRMLQMRARGFAARDGAADVLGGLYIKEELDDVEATATTLAPRRSAHAVRKSGEYERFETSIRFCKSTDGIDTEFANWSALMATWPESFVANAHGFVEAMKMQLEAAKAEGTDEPPITDVAGYLAKLREDRGYCESEADLAELKKSNAEIIARLSAADQLAASAILELDAE